MTDDEVVSGPAVAAGGAPPRRVIVLAFVVGAMALVAIWGDAVPREVACAATYPDGCGTAADRERAGIVWSAVVGTLFLVTTALAFGCRGRARWLPWVALVALVWGSFVGYGAVVGSTGYVIAH